jgi:hypothetical protein
MRVRDQISERGPEFMRGGRTWEVRLRQYDLVNQTFERFEKASMVFVSHHPEDQNCGTRPMSLVRVRKKVCQSCCGSRIMCAIQQDGRIAIGEFQSPGPIDPA